MAIAEYIAQDNPAAAYAVHDAIQRQVERLAQHPRIGRPGRVEGTRELVVSGTPYIVAYRVAGQDVTILRVLHGAQQWPQRL
jgi:toxin ParE1/3/4